MRDEEKIDQDNIRKVGEFSSLYQPNFKFALDLGLYSCVKGPGLLGGLDITPVSGVR